MRDSGLIRLWLIAVRIVMAPVPIVPLNTIVLSLVLTISPVPCCEVTPVGAIFTVIPIVIIPMVPIIDADLDVAVLRLRASHDGGWRSQGGNQRQRTDKTIQKTHDIFLHPEVLRLRITVGMTMRRYCRNVCSIQHAFENKNSPNQARLSRREI